MSSCDAQAITTIPFTIASGAPFPNRDLIIFVTFGVIIITLVGQGLMLPSVVRWLGLGRDSEYERQRERQAEMAARLTALDIAQQRLQELAKERNLPDDVRTQLRARIQHRRQQLPASADGVTDNLRLGAKLRSELIAAERRHLHQLLRKGQITDEARRRIERELDLEEQAILCGKDDPPL